MKRFFLFAMCMTFFFTGSLWLSAQDPAAAPPAKVALQLLQLPNQTHSQMMSYLLLCDDGSLVVLDGGTRGDAQELVSQIKKIRPDGHISAWFLTHLHSDHFGALCQIMAEQPTELTIDCIYFNAPPVEWFVENRAQDGQDFYQALPTLGKTATPQPGETWTFGSVTIEALNDVDPTIGVEDLNNTSVVYRVETPETSILFLGDLGVEGGKRLLKLVPPNKIQADIVQMAHHGQCGVNRDFYEQVKPNVCLWCAPDWLWNNNSGNGDGSGPWKTVQTRAWMDDLGVKTHYVIKDGLITLDLP